MEDRDRLIQKGLDGELSEEEEARFQRLLEEDRELLEELSALKGLKRDLASMPRLEPPSGLKRKVMGRLPTGGWLGLLSRPILTLTPATAAVAILLVAGLVFLRPGASVVKKTPDSAAEEVLVRLSINYPSAKSVNLVGSFNDWKKGEIPLSDEAGDGRWKVTVALKPGVYEYMFVVDGKHWVVDPNADFLKDDGFGRANGILEI